ncbi:hypothetical protein LshimejAT787_0502980 [Lyophyllum shimeji]|uniref:Uncharacterized protein n=1 Tax=Lyophyllum shimeji TaxID=47721 RepID=A0A9P3PN07_LYOSH|nr:hypothetical protein LshimejAT787_0502980 [Lyophyllum shimeji]
MLRILDAAFASYQNEKHSREYTGFVLSYKLKGWEALVSASRDHRPGERPPFTLEGFYEHLIRWIAVDDQSINVVDCEAKCRQ